MYSPLPGAGLTERLAQSAERKSLPAAVTFLDVSSCDNSDMSGIAKFVNLRTLYCSANQLTSLDVSNNTALILLNCGNILLTTLDISNNISLGLGAGGYGSCFLDIGDMPSLEKVCVWKLPFPPPGFLLCSEGSQMCILQLIAVNKNRDYLPGFYLKLIVY